MSKPYKHPSIKQQIQNLGEYLSAPEKKPVDTLREHLTRIAIKRQKDLKEKLGKEGYSKAMSNIRKGKTKPV